MVKMSRFVEAVILAGLLPISTEGIIVRCPDQLQQPATNTDPAVLVTDIMFPSTISAWRLNQISMFIEEVQADILVPSRVNEYAGVQFPFQWVPLQELLSDYDLIIFNPTVWSWPGVAEAAAISNVTRAHALLPVDYLIRHKKRRHEPVDISRYHAVHHMFQMTWQGFMTRFPWVPPCRQSIWFAARTSCTNEHLHTGVYLITTDLMCLAVIRRHMPHNPLLPLLGMPILNRRASMVKKPLKSPHEKLVVAMASVGNVQNKGADVYVKLAELYHARYPGSNVVFYGIGNIPSSPIVVPLATMPQVNLSMLYRNEVDVMFSPESHNGGNTWPMGTEAVVQGAVLFSTDFHDMNRLNGYLFDKGFVKITVEADECLSFLRQYELNRTLLHEHSQALQARAWQLWNYDALLKPIRDVVLRRAMA